MMRPSLHGMLTIALTGLLAAGSAAAEDRKPASSDEAFYRGLIELKLLDLLDFAIKRNPPADEITRLLLQREVRLVLARDPLVEEGRRHAALAEANAMLERIITEHPTDPRAFQWRLDLAGAMLYDEAEPYYSALLYRGGSDADRQALNNLMQRVRRLLTEMQSSLTREYARLDEIPIPEYERLENSGYVAELEAAGPRAEYMLRWANFYASLGLPPDDPQRRAILEQISDDFAKNKELLETPHNVSHVQAQLTLLAGMVSRRLHNNEAAVRYLQDAVDTARNVPDPQERKDIAWVVMLGGVETVRALRDLGRFDQADSAVAELRRGSDDATRDFGRELLVALLATSVAQARGGVPGEAALGVPLSDAAVKPLVELAERGQSERDAVYAALYDQIKNSAQERKLHPFQQCALIAGLIGEASRLRHGGAAEDSASLKPAQPADQAADEARAVALLDRAIALAKDLTAERAGLEPRIYCEALFNRGVAEFHRGLRADAAGHFVEIATECPAFSRALIAATYAVELAAQLVDDPALRSRPEVQDLYLRALGTLIEKFPDSDAARYWRFFYAQALEDLHRFEEARAEYAKVSDNHALRIVAQFRSARSQCLAVKDLPAATPEQKDLVRTRAQAARRAIEQFQSIAAQAGSVKVEGTDVPRLRAEADVLLAELELTPGVDRPDDALAALKDFESRHEGYRDLMGRVLKSRVVAYEATGRLREAQEAVPAYIASAPEEAGPTLQSLFEAAKADIAQLRKSGRADDAKAKARGAVLFAQQLYEWAAGRKPPLSDTDLFVLRLQWADALGEAGQTAEALPMYKQCADFDAKRQPDGQPHDRRVLLGMARLLAESGQYRDALPLYNRAFTENDGDNPERFEALLGDLTCRTELGQDATAIINVIKQHRFLVPEMGGPQLKAAFAALQQRNETRARQSPSPTANP